MQKIKNILVPLDDSSTCLKGLKLALKFAKSLDAKIIALNVIIFSNDFKFPVSSEMKKIHTKNADKIISDAKKVVNKENISFTGKIVKGDNIGREIVKFAKNKKVDLIIIGSRGPHPDSEVFLGSVANYILHKSSIPITIVK